jgi:hypothetical protein
LRQHYIPKWFPADEEADTGFMSVSLPARALWRHMIRVMVEAAPYGFFVGTAGEPIDLTAFARRIGSQPQEVRRLIGELINAKVPSVDSQDRIFCRRLVRDEAKRQQLLENGLRANGEGSRINMFGGHLGGAKSRSLPGQGGGQTQQQNDDLAPSVAPGLVRARARNAITHSNSDSLRSSALEFGSWPQEVERLRALAMIFVAEFARCRDPLKAEKHVPHYTGVLAAMRSRGVTIEAAWQACCDAREGNSDKPLWAAAIKTAISFLPAKPFLRPISGGRSAPQSGDDAADLAETLRKIQER